MNWPSQTPSGFKSRLCLVLAASLLLVPIPAHASIEGCVEIWQPFVEPGMGSVVLYTVPYSVFGYLHDSLELITAENRVLTERTGVAFENRNAAQLAGLKVWKDSKPDTWMGFYGDTLRVVLDATKVDTTAVPEAPSPESLIDATVECIRATVSPFEGSSGNALRYLEVTVEGVAPRRTVYDLRAPHELQRHFEIRARR